MNKREVIKFVIFTTIMTLLCATASLILFGVVIKKLDAYKSAPIKPFALSSQPFNADVEKPFDTGISNLVGWKVKANGQDGILYSTRDGKYLIFGVMLDAKGENLTQKQLKEHVALSSGTLPDGQQALNAIMKQVNGAAIDGLTIRGDLAGDIFIVVDLNCPYCHRLVGAVTTMIKSGKSHATIHYVPIAILGESSALAAAALKQVPKENRLAALKEWMAGKLVRDPVKAFLNNQPDQASLIGDAQYYLQNGQAFQQAGLTAVPDILWLDKEGKLQHYQGLPSNNELESLLKRSL